MRTRVPSLTLVLAGSVAAALLAAPAALAHVDGRYEASGALVDVSVEVDGRLAPLYPAPDGSGRYYLEARRGARYAVRVSNRSGARVGVVLAVDGLNAISGEIEPASVGRAPGRPGRMYVLDPWGDVTVRGWRTSLHEVRRFTFVDEGRSYAARSEKSNRKMGWIEVRVYRERDGHVWRRPGVVEPWERPEPGRAGERDAARDAAGPSGAGGAPEPQAESSRESAAKSAQAPRARADAEGFGPGRSDSGYAGRRESYPGTGWGARADDPVTVVRFDPEPYAADTVRLRYEYRRALVELGVLPHWRDRDRLAERDGARGGFARPPRH